MEAHSRDWPRTVFRLSGLPSTTTRCEDVASILGGRLGGIPAGSIQIFSLATAMAVGGSSRSKVATVMFEKTPLLVQSDYMSKEWLIPATSSEACDFILDTHFMGITPLADVEPAKHAVE